jgi:hypothetical protein
MMPFIPSTFIVPIAETNPEKPNGCGLTVGHQSLGITMNANGKNSINATVEKPGGHGVMIVPHLNSRNGIILSKTNWKIFQRSEGQKQWKM